MNKKVEMDFKGKVVLLILHVINKKVFSYLDFKKILIENKTNQAYQHTLRQLERRGYVESISTAIKPKGVRKQYCLSKRFFEELEQIKGKTILFLEGGEPSIIHLFNGLGIDINTVIKKLGGNNGNNR